MAKQYSQETRREAIKLALEIGNRQAAERLGINLDTLYTWISKNRQRSAAMEAVIREKGPEGLLEENTQLKRELREKLEEIEILQDALGFFVKRRKK